MLEVLDCSKSFPFGLCQKLLSVKNHLSLKLFFFYKLSSRLKLVWAFYLLSAREDLESFLSAKSSWQASRQLPLRKIMQEPNFAKVRWAYQATSLAQKFSVSKISEKVRPFAKASG